MPIGHVTNGVHFPTWVGAPMRELLDRHLGADWLHRAADPRIWAAVDGISDQELWDVRERQRAELVSFVAERSLADRLARGDSREYVEAAARCFDPHVLTIGFARRVATYKRLELLMRDPDWTLSLLGGECPVQVVLAGKAHPATRRPSARCRRCSASSTREIIGQRVVFLDDYDLTTGARLAVAATCG